MNSGNKKNPLRIEVLSGNRECFHPLCRIYQILKASGNKIAVSGLDIDLKKIYDLKKKPLLITGFLCSTIAAVGW